MINRFSSWYTVIIDLTTRSNVNIYNLITSNSQWTNNSKKLRAFITIPNGNTIHSTSASIPAITIPNQFRYYDRITIVNNGTIVGASGVGGAGGIGRTSPNGSAGGVGGTALLIQNNIFLENNGLVTGGGGGGGGGAGFYYTTQGSAVKSCCDASNCDDCPVNLLTSAYGGPNYWYDTNNYTCKCGVGSCTGFCNPPCCNPTQFGLGGSNCVCYVLNKFYGLGGAGGAGRSLNAAGVGDIGTLGAANGGNGGGYGASGSNGLNTTQGSGGAGGLGGYYIIRQNSANYILTGSGTFSGRLL
jgi:hypothetical protein